jgi:protoheme IX farnesyltransferase
VRRAKGASYTTHQPLLELLFRSLALNSRCFRPCRRPQWKNAVNTRFARFAWSVLAYNVLVILWGAFVRATRSGDGCGEHWPKCHDQIIPHAASETKTWVEFAHRVMSGIDGFIILALCIWAFRVFAKGSPVRKAALATLIFTIIEAGIGAVLVKRGLVANNDSLNRAVVMSLHLVNTLFLMGSLTLTAWWASGNSRISWRGQGAMGFGIFSSIVAFLSLAVTGALAALGDTVFPAKNYDALISAVQRDMDPNAAKHIFEHLRSFHPYTSLGVGLWLLLICGLCGHLRPSRSTQMWMRATITLFLFQVAVGLVNLLILAPVWMQIFHLFVANALWVSLVLMSASALAVDCPRVEMEEVDAQVLGDQVIAGSATGLPPSTSGAPGASVLKVSAVPEPVDEETVVLGPVWKEYLALTKPRVISLLLFTTMTAMFIGAGGWPGMGLFLATSVGLYMAAGAANAINMVCERDLDLRMERTSKRPTLTTVPAPKALWFAFGLAIGSFLLLTFVANLLAALMALSGLVVYVIVYTLLLKRRTWSNIVIGGAAGAFPPLVGYAAVTNNLSPLAWCLFALVFVWTPVHFWALALLIKDDYARAGVPMLPVVRGDRYTVVQIALYAVATVAISLAPFALNEGGVVGAGWLYGVCAVALNAILLWRSVQLYQNPSRPRASSLFHYSMLYLALLFLALAIDRSSLAASRVRSVAPTPLSYTPLP